MNLLKTLLEVSAKEVDPKMEYHNVLSPKLWSGKNINTDVKPALMKIVQQFFKDIDFQPKVLDITILGSSCNYNYSKISDLDIHIIVDYPQDDITYRFLNTSCKNWLSKHTLSFKGFPIELYCQAKNEKISKTAAIYSIQNNKWVREPEKEIPPPKFDDPKVLKQAAEIMTRIDAAVGKKASKAVEQELLSLKDEIKQLRKKGISILGEYDISNLVFKTLRNNKYMDKLVDRLNEVIDARLSVK